MNPISHDRLIDTDDAIYGLLVNAWTGPGTFHDLGELIALYRGSLPVCSDEEISEAVGFLCRCGLVEVVRK